MYRLRKNNFIADRQFTRPLDVQADRRWWMGKGIIGHSHTRERVLFLLRGEGDRSCKLLLGTFGRCFVKNPNTFNHARILKVIKNDDVQ